MQERADLKSACSSLSNLSTAFFNLSKTMLRKTLPMTDNRVMPRQLLQCVVVHIHNY